MKEGDAAGHPKKKRKPNCEYSMLIACSFLGDDWDPADFPEGTCGELRYYELREELVLHCHSQKHSPDCSCRKSKTTKLSKRAGDHWLGQGAPLGMMMAWLRGHSLAKVKSEHRDLPHAPFPPGRRARNDFSLLHGSENFLKQEKRHPGVTWKEPPTVP